MPRLETHLDQASKLAFREVARRAAMTEAALLRQIIRTTIEKSALAARGDLTHRSLRIHLRIDPDLMKAIREAAEEFGMTSAGVVLATARARLLSQPTLIRSEALALIRATHELAKVGINLNQLVRLTHQQKLGNAFDQGTTLAQLATVVTQMRTELCALMSKATERWRITEELQ